MVCAKVYQWLQLVFYFVGASLFLSEAVNAEFRVRRNVPMTLFKWPDAIVPYVFDTSFDASLKQDVKQAMAYMEKYSCVRFKRWTDEENHVKFVSRYGCSSDVGMQFMKDFQFVSLEGSCAKGKGTVIHELMHALGFVHEHQRKDRDQYIKIHTKNIKPDMRAQFRQRTDLRLFATYDVDSIMQYPENYGAKDNKKPTITQLMDKVKFKIGQRDHLSDIDKFELNKLYCGTRR